MFEKREVRTFITRWFCEECRKEFKPIGTTLLSSPPLYPHVCECGKRKNAKQRYPLTTVEEILT